MIATLDLVKENQKVIEENASLKKCSPKLEKIGLRGNPGSLTVLGKGDEILRIKGICRSRRRLQLPNLQSPSS